MNTRSAAHARPMELPVSTERLALPPNTNEQGHQFAAPPLAANARAELVPEHRLWKVCRQTVSPKLRKIDSLAFAFFAVVAVVAIACSLSMLFHVLDSGALEETVRTLIAR